MQVVEAKGGEQFGKGGEQFGKGGEQFGKGGEQFGKGGDKKTLDQLLVLWYNLLCQNSGVLFNEI